jgi:hypothetical protein
MDLFDLDNARDPDDWYFSSSTEFQRDESANDCSSCDSGSLTTPPTVNGQYRMMDLPPYDSSLFELAMLENPIAQDISNGFVDNLSQVPWLEDKQNSVSGISSDSEPPLGMPQPQDQNDTSIPGVQGVIPNALSTSALVDWNHDWSLLRQGEKANCAALVETNPGRNGGGLEIACADSM